MKDIIVYLMLTFIFLAMGTTFANPFFEDKKLAKKTAYLASVAWFLGLVLVVL